MRTFIKAQSALIAGSAADFLFVFLLVSILNCWFVPANVAGNILGAAAQFIISRHWVFNASANSLPLQARKFVIMWAGDIALSALVVYLLTHHFHIHYLLSKLAGSVLLGPTYTYLVCKRFVFA